MTDTQSELQIPPGYVQDRQGNLVPKARVKQIDKDRDILVRRLAKNAKRISGLIGNFKEDAFADVADFASASAAEYGAKMGGLKGNMTLFSYDGQFKIQISVNENRTFDERLQTAKTLIDGCIHKWMKGASKNLQAIVDQAFQVDKQGKVSVERIFGLRKLDIDDEDWHRAMAAIADSVQITGSKKYFRIYERIGTSDEYRPISLDVANA